MGYEKEHEDNLQAKSCVVEATDPEGRVAGREAFATQAEADTYAASMRAKGFKVSQSQLDASAEAVEATKA